MITNKYKQLQENTFNKVAHKYPPLEEIQPHVSYALSISPMIQKHSVIEQHGCDELIFEILAKHSSIKLYPELSTKTTRWHYHGFITFNSEINISSFYFYSIHKLKELCTFTIIPIESIEEWTLYIFKQRHLMYYLCLKNQCPYQIQYRQGLFKPHNTIHSHHSKAPLNANPLDG